jgi:hypothetical protein
VLQANLLARLLEHLPQSEVELQIEQVQVLLKVQAALKQA